MINQTELRDYFNSVINKNNYTVFANLLNLPNELFKRVTDLLITNEINILDILKLTPVTPKNIETFINSLEKNYTFPELGDMFIESPDFDAVDYLHNDLNLNILVKQFNRDIKLPFSDSKISNISKDILFGIIQSNKGFYTNRNQLVLEINELILPRLSSYNDLETSFPLDDVNISNLFQGSQDTKDLFLRIYKDIFLERYIVESFHLEDKAEAYIELFFNSQLHISYIKTNWFYVAALFNHNLLHTNFRMFFKKLHFEAVQLNRPYELSEIETFYNEVIDNSFKTNFSNKLTCMYVLNYIKKQISTDIEYLDELENVEYNINIIKDLISLLSNFIKDFEQESNKYLNI